MIGSIVIVHLIKLNGTLVSLPEGMNPSDMDSLQANMGKFKLLNYLVMFLAHSLGTLAGSIVAGAIAVSDRAIFINIVAFLFLLCGIAMVIMLPSPLWFAFTDLTFAYILVAWLAAKFAKK